jgi:DNA invertase Pin-like site-specific DNA recombinase
LHRETIGAERLALLTTQTQLDLIGIYRHWAGIEAARQQNGELCPWGGREAGKPNKATLAKVDVMRQLQAQGKPIAEIARVVGLTRQTIYRLLGSAPASPK